jgi:Tol biopolymer transport system component
VKEQKMKSKKISLIFLTAMMLIILAVTPVCADWGWGTPIQLTHNTVEDSYPSISADGNTIAFQSYVEGDYEIFVINSDGTELTQLTHNTMQDEFPSISADGSTIAFRWFVDDEYKIFVVNPDGTLTELADFAYQVCCSYHSPSISADGSTIAFSDYSAVFVVNSDGMDLTQVTDTSSRDIFPSISGDGSTIAFMSTVIGCGWEIFVINPDGSDLTQLTFNTAQDGNPSISADGTKIAFKSNVDGDFEIFVVNPDGSDLTQLTYNTVYDGSPTISADGSKIAFHSSGYIFVVNSDGSGLTQVTDIYAAAPSISADGTKIAFYSNVDGDLEIFVVSYTEIPVADANGPYTGFEGSPIPFYGTESYDPDGTIVNYEWDFGDGETATGATPTHAYGDNGIYQVTLTVTDDDGGAAIDTSMVTVYNAAPIIEAGDDQTANEGEFVNFIGSFTDPGWLDMHTIVWDFGDGETAIGTLTPTHTYGDNETYPVTLTVTDDDGGTGTDTLIVTVNNVAPTASIDSVEQPNAHFILPYHELTFIGSFTDPGWLDTHTIEWEFGDGETATGTLTPTHAYSDNGMYPVILTVTDDDGGIGTDNMEITILSEEEAITTVDDNIQDLSDDAFKINPDQRKNALSEKLDEVIGLIEAGEYQEAIEKLQNDIRAKADGYVDGNPVNDWITDPDEQQELCMMVDDLIAYLETLL